MLFIVICFMFIVSCTGYLNVMQLNLIKTILQNKQSPEYMVIESRRLLAKHYIPFAFKEFRNFTVRNKKYIKNISLHDLRQYALLGLCRAGTTYDGRTSFANYSKKYILGFLHKGVTVLEPLSPRTKEERLSGKRLPIIVWETDVVDWYPNLQKKSINIYSQEIEYIKNIIDKQTPFEKQLFYYRYSPETLKKTRKISEVCELLSISDETFRKKMNILLKKIGGLK